MKIGVKVKLDVTKIEKHRLFKGKKGTYLDATTFINLDDTDDYGNNGFVSQDVSKQEQDNGKKGNIIGNVKVFWRNDDQQEQQEQQTERDLILGSEDIPF